MSYMIIIFFVIFSSAQDIHISTPCFSIPRHSVMEADIPQQSEFTLNIVKNKQDSRMEFDYVLRWDFDDFKRFNMSFKGLRSIICSVKVWDITERTRLNFFGFRINPWRIIIKKEKASGQDLGLTENSDKKPQYQKKLVISLAPLIEDLTDDFDKQVQNVLLEESFKKVIPQWEGIDRKSKKSFIRDLLSIEGLWQYEKLDIPRKGLEYISK